MNEAAFKENSQTLRRLLNLNEESSHKILESSILISVGQKHNHLQKYLVAILKRSFEIVHTSPEKSLSYSCEIFCNEMDRQTEAAFVHLGVANHCIIVSSNNFNSHLPDNFHPFIYYLVACYTGPVILKAIFKELIKENSEEISIDYRTLIKNEKILNERIDVGNIYLAGAGAIGNSFLYALSTFNIDGVINICDPDFISGGNLNRCLFFEDSDIGRYKVDVLLEKAQPLFSSFKLIPFQSELGKVPSISKGERIEKLVVGVDSRRARRNLQNEIPKQVFDASTTGISEVVIYHGKLDLKKACLGCIYKRELQEEAHEKHVAEALGVNLVHIRRQFIDAESANLIASKYSINPQDLINIPYDTVFKQLCGEGKLMTQSNLQVLAPLAFVSALAGGLLALRFIEEHHKLGDFNYWRVSPWANLNFRLKQQRLIDPECEICNKETFQKAVMAVWGIE
jgi:molybdopterin/thiamine biosynthesis adenylyltransferase